MKRIRTDAQYIKDLVSEGEHELQDFKFEISDAKKIAKSLSAFANTKGGRLLVGVKDNGKMAGIRSEEEIYMIEAAASIYCQPPVHVLNIPHIVEGKTILEVIIDEVPNKPIYAMDVENKLKAYVKAQAALAKAKSATAYVAELKRMIKARTGADMEPWLMPQVRATASNMVVMDKKVA